MQTCSACREPLLRGQKAKIVGTEVFHRACVGRTSTLQRAAARIRDLETELARTRAERDIAQQSARAAEGRVGILEATRQSEHVELTRAVASANSYKAAFHRAESREIEAAQEVDLRIAERDRAREEVSATREKLFAAERALAIAQSGQSLPEDLPEDSTEARFRLLELK